MPHRTTARLRELLAELTQAQHLSGDVADKARRKVAGAIAGDDLKPVGTSGAQRRKKKAGRKKR